MGYLLRLFIIALLIWLAYRFIRKLVEPARGTDPGKLRGEEMVRCEVCGLHVPRKSALRRDDRYYCSQEHLESQPRD
jgi:uncharacterized protein